MGTLLGEKRKGAATLSKQKGQSLSFKYPVEYWVAAQPGEDRLDVITTPGLPLVGVTNGLGLTCVSKNATRDEVNTGYWTVVCEFESSNDGQEQDPNNPSDDPTTWIPIAKITFELKEKVIWTDKSSSPKKIVNSANQPFDTPLVELRSISCLDFVQFESASLSLKTITDRNNCINTSTFRGYAAKTILLTVREAEIGYFGNYEAWRIAYSAKYDPDTWDEERLDVGSSYLASGVLKPYMDDENLYRIVGNLAADGSKRAMSSSPLTKSFQIFDDISFSFIRT
jgi:hypothetical protein